MVSTKMSELSGYIRFGVKKSAKRQADIEQEYNRAMLRVCMIVTEEFPGVEISTSNPVISKTLSELL